MSLVKINVPIGIKIAVIGDIHEHEDQFDEIINKINPSPQTLLVSVGDIYDKGWGEKKAASITRKLKTMCDAGFAYVLRGNHELSQIRRARYRDSLDEELAWLDKQPLAVSFQFSTGTLLTVVHGGIKPSHTWEDLNSDVETSYIRTIDSQGRMIKKVWVADKSGKKTLVPEKAGGTSWHDLYDGRFGYVVSGHDAQKDGIPKFYNYSCNIDTACYQTGILTAAIFSERGREEVITVTGKPKSPP